MAKEESKKVYFGHDVKTIGHVQIGPRISLMTVQDLHHIIVRAIENGHGRKFIKTACDHCGGVNKIVGINLLFDIDLDEPDKEEKILNYVGVVLVAEPFTEL